MFGFLSSSVTLTMMKISNEKKNDAGKSDYQSRRREMTGQTIGVRERKDRRGIGEGAIANICSPPSKTAE